MIGVNFQTAPISIREKAAFTPDILTHALKNALCHDSSISELVIVSTCNRTEIYCAGNESQTHLINWLITYQNFSPSLFQKYYYVFSGEEAIMHLMRVASGLDSQILGEPQIFGQLKDAYAIAHQAGVTGKYLSKLFQSVFATAKKVRTHTSIGKHPQSVAYTTVKLIRQIFSNIQDHNALVIGAGDTARLVATHLKEQGVRQITVANRSLERAHNLAKMVNGSAIMLSHIPEFLSEADIVISSTSSQLPILGKGVIERAMKKRRGNPIFLADIAMPRDIEPEAAEIPNVFLYTLNQLNSMVANNITERREAAKKAEKLISSASQSYFTYIRSMNANHAIKNYRANAHLVKNQLINKAKQQILHGLPIEEALEQMANRLTNKLIHTPCVQLRGTISQEASKLSAHQINKNFTMLNKTIQSKDVLNKNIANTRKSVSSELPITSKKTVNEQTS